MEPRIRSHTLTADQSLINVVSKLDQEKLPSLLELKYQSLDDAKTKLGGAAEIRGAFIGFRNIYMLD